MNLEDIGFYTLFNERAKNTSWCSDLQRCELLVTHRCNFNCPYCRGFKKEDQVDLSWGDAQNILNKWASQKLHNVRFSGGEPTLWKHLPEAVKLCFDKNIKRIAISTNGSKNGSNELDYYKHLIKCGVNDFSISLDACCSSTGNKMAGGISGVWDKVIKNIEELSKLSYVTIGVVLLEDNSGEAYEIVKLGHELGVDDIRLITDANQNIQHLSEYELLKLNNKILNNHPILKYRINRACETLPVRGISNSDCPMCYLVIDDMTVLNGKTLSMYYLS